MYVLPKRDALIVTLRRSAMVMIMQLLQCTLSRYVGEHFEIVAADVSGAFTTLRVT